MKVNSLISLLHIADPTLPIGGYSHSNGLETYVQKGLVNSTETAALFLNNMLSSSILHNDAAYVRLAYEAMKEKDSYERIVVLDEECSAMKSPREIREASHKLGTRLLKIFIEEGQKCDFLTKFGDYVTKNISVGNYLNSLLITSIYQSCCLFHCIYLAINSYCSIKNKRNINSTCYNEYMNKDFFHLRANLLSFSSIACHRSRNRYLLRNICKNLVLCWQ